MRRMPYHLKNFKTRMLIILCIIMVFASMLSLTGSLVYMNANLRGQIWEAQQRAAGIIMRAYQEYNKGSLSTEDILKVFSDQTQSVSVVDDIDSLHLSQNDLETLAESQILFGIEVASGEPATLLRIGDSILKITTIAHDTSMRKTGLQVMLTLAACIGLFLLLTTASAGWMLRPITRLTQATQKVAKGDFSVEIPVERDDEIGMLTRNFNQMAKELGSIEYLQKDFISSVSHEFKTPIASIQGFATLLKDPSLSPEERAEYTDIILNESKRLSRLSANLLRLSKLESQQRPSESTRYRLDEQLRQTVLLLEPEWSKKNIQWQLEIEDMPFIGDEELLQQVWINLIDNAIKFSPPGGEIEIALYASDAIKVRVRDNGPGMDEVTLARIFDKFYQGDSSHSDQGNGLGLSLVKRILDLCGGQIRVKSIPGEGSTFTVELPIVKE